MFPFFNKMMAILFGRAELYKQFWLGWPYEEHLGEIILNLSKQFRRILSFKDFSILSSGGLFCLEE